MSGFTRDRLHYGDALVYEALESKWRRYHDRCGCGQDWVKAHAIPAGFRVVRRRPGFVALVGPGLTEDVDEAALTTNALWHAVVGYPGAQDWPETVRVIERTDDELATPRPPSPHYTQLRARSKEAKSVPLTEPQAKYLTTLATKVSRVVFDEHYAAATKGTQIAQRQDGEKTAAMIERLTRDAARNLITLLVGHR